ncbi:MAG: T9SS type A sorting domain-containing protein [Bacteroidota bacterium]
MKKCILSFLFALLLGFNMSAQHPVMHTTGINYAVAHDVSPPLKVMQMLEPATQNARWEKGEIPNKFFPFYWNDKYTAVVKTNTIDPVIQDKMGLLQPIIPELNFNGIVGDGNTAPSDANGAVGINYFIETVNTAFAVYTKSGALVYGPANLKTIWQGFPGNYTSDGDPIVLFDHLANRWLISQFSLPNYPNGPFYELIAISQTEDPMGSWNRYAFQFSQMPDYPKLGVWPDGYYLSVNSFTSGTSSWVGPLAAVLERDSMLVGNLARMVFFQQGPELNSLIPADLDGPTSPAGTPGYFLSAVDDAMGDTADQLRLYELHVDWPNNAQATFSGPSIINTAAFDMNMCGNSGSGCIPQKGTSRKLEALPHYLMYRLQYRNFGAYQSMLINHSVNANGDDHAGVRWYELRKTSNEWNIYQQGTYAPDALHRWMASIAMDVNGNIAMGYSVSGDTVFPSIGVSCRRAGDPPGLMTSLEEMIIEGTGSQLGTSRWGDYTSLSIDPADDETFWYTNQYYPVSSSMKWSTRIASFSINDLPLNAENRNIPAKSPHLNCNIPNPFSTATTIRWTLAGPCKVRIKVFDIRGKTMKMLVDANQEAGEHSVELNASGMAAGVYLCMFTAADTAETQKLVIIK